MRYFLIVLCVIALLLLFFLFPHSISSSKSEVVLAETKPLTDQLFERIALCESQNDPHIKNPSSSASGRFQFLWGTWNHYGRELWGDLFYEKNIFSYQDNTELALYVYKKYGTGDWLASKSCWQK